MTATMSAIRQPGLRSMAALASLSAALRLRLKTTTPLLRLLLLGHIVAVLDDLVP